MILRLPAALFAAAVVILFLPLPYVYFNSDSAIAAFMGADLLERGYLPTYFYGQNYFLSFTPYAFALAKWSLGWLGLGDVTLFKLAGLAISLGGFWLLYETALLGAPNRGQALTAGAVFVLLFASFPSAALRMYDTSQAEQYYFCFGLMIFALAMLQRAMETSGAATGRWWALLGAAFFYSLHSRPQAVIFGVFGLAAILFSSSFRFRRRDWRPLAAGALAGNVLYITHQALHRAHWPFTGGGPSHTLGSGEKIAHQFHVTLAGILPHLLELSTLQPLSSTLVALLICLAFVHAARRAWPFAQESLSRFGAALAQSPKTPRLAMAAIFALVAALHLAALVIYLATGPFEIHNLGLHITMTDSAKPLVIALGALTLAAAFRWPPRIDSIGGLAPCALEASLVCGSCLLIALLIFVKDLGADVGSARYLAVLPAVAALLAARWALTLSPRRQKALLGLVVLLFLTSIPRWGAMIGWETKRNEEFARSLAAIAPLAAEAPVIWADYWDAYSLAFAGGDKPLVEAYPFQKVRRYGRVSRQMAGQGLWLAREADLETILQQARAIEPQAHYQISRRVILYGNVTYVVFKFDDASMAEKMMDANHPLYFKTTYPPGS
ncbi:MAG: hypothetical protein OEV92_10130 [Nitrospinota bacterium]|nr:hypothetical protein [Nitrospinota bacterium]